MEESFLTFIPGWLQTSAHGACLSVTSSTRAIIPPSTAWNTFSESLARRGSAKTNSGRPAWTATTAPTSAPEGEEEEGCGEGLPNVFAVRGFGFWEDLFPRSSRSYTWQEVQRNEHANAHGVEMGQ